MQSHASHHLVTLGALAALVILHSVDASAAEDAPGENLVQNGDFSEDGGWAFFSSGADASGERTTETAYVGEASYKLTNRSGFAPHVYGRIFQHVGGIKPYSTYRISCRVRGEDIGIAWIGGGPGWRLRAPIPEGTYDTWTLVSAEWFSEEQSDPFELMVLLESETKALYVDDIQMTLVRTDYARRDEAIASLREGINAQRGRLDAVRAEAATTPGAAEDAATQLGLYIAERFLDRVSDETTEQSLLWSIFQVAEVGTVLDETERRLERVSSGQVAVAPHPFPTDGRAEIRDGLFHVDTTTGERLPYYFYGFGHFGQVFRDLPNWRRLGVTLVQDGRLGPSAMRPDGGFVDDPDDEATTVASMLADLDEAARHGVRVDHLLSPHYFPEWAFALPDSEGLRDGLGFGYNIDHPIAREVVGTWADRISAALADRPALFSICLTNEPVYSGSGRDPQSLPLYQAYLARIHGEIATLNELYGTDYDGFDEIAPPDWGITDDVARNRAFYDWARFNQRHFADWHAWMAGIIRKNLPDTPIHAKPMVFFSFDRDKFGWGVDPELFCEVSDIAGCDAYAFPAGDYASFQWHGHAFWYDLLHAFRGQPVFNSENHIIPDGTGQVHLPMTMTRAQFWQGALHHQAATTTWVWDEARDAALKGSIYFRPANVYGAGRAFLDINRFAREVSAVNQAQPRFALLYAMPSVFWEEDYRQTIWDAYTHLSFLGEKVTFVSETMLREGRVPDVAWIALPKATHVSDATVAALDAFAAAGGKVLHLGDDNLAYDAYHRRRDALPPRLAEAPAFSLLDEGNDTAAVHAALRDLLAHHGTEITEARDAASGALCWDVEYRTLPYAGKTLAPVISFNTEDVTVQWPAFAGRSARDLLSGETVDPMALTLAPMTPMLLLID